jgi:hypothetical protein
MTYDSCKRSPMTAVMTANRGPFHHICPVTVTSYCSRETPYVRTGRTSIVERDSKLENPQSHNSVTKRLITVTKYCFEFKKTQTGCWLGIMPPIFISDTCTCDRRHTKPDSKPTNYFFSSLKCTFSLLPFSLSISACRRPKMT